jgi:poly-gamma-glutamate synthesis protein (capsule biosynthesis protein)
MFTGDVHLGPAYNDQRLFSDEIRAACLNSDYVVVNVEGPITNSLPSRRPGAILHSSSHSARILRAFGNNIFNLANNHVLDHGVAGLRDTLQFARDRGWQCVGAGETFAEASAPCILEHHGITVGLLSVCGCGVPFAGKSSPGVFGDRPESPVRERIRELKARTRWVVVVYHGGEEFAHIPLPARRKKLLRYLSFGADVVVAHHAHCVQRYEQLGNKLVMYGLGNLVFDLDHHRNFASTDESVLISLSFSEQSIRYNTLFTRQDRKQRLVVNVSSNMSFRQINERSYAQEWGAEASRRLKSYWSHGHEQLARDKWRQKCFYYWKKALRVAGLVHTCVFDKYGLTRPYIIGGVMYQIKHLMHPEIRRGKTP